jgi:hypothetical protein
MDLYYYLNGQNEQIGPVQANELLKHGVTKDTLVWKEGMNNWLAAGTIPELSGLFATVAQTGWKKYLMWAAIVIGVIIVYSAIVGDDEITSIEDGMNYLDGKTFVCVEKGMSWFKLSFANETFTLWRQSPAAGEWGEPFFRGKYTVEEGRYSNTGERYWATRITDAEIMYGMKSDNWKRNEYNFIFNMLIAFNITRSSLRFSDNPDAEGDYYSVKAVKSDYNPWN